MLLQFANRPVSVERPKRLFISYSHNDRQYVDLFLEALFPLKRDGLVSEWQDHMISPGDRWHQRITDELDLADVVLFWISPSFLASQYCADVEIKRAMARAKDGHARVIPVLLHPVALGSHELFTLQVLPPRGRPIALYEEPAKGVQEVVESLRLLLLDQRFANDEGTGGVWMLRVFPNDDGIEPVEPEALAARLVEMTRDVSIRLVGHGALHGTRRGPSDAGTVLILRGSAAAYERVHGAYVAGTLSRILGVRVLDFDQSVGSTLRTACTLFPVDGASAPEPDRLLDDLLYPSEPGELPTLKGIVFSESNPLASNFIMDRCTCTDHDAHIEARRAVDEFMTALLLTKENLWVNLSAYESNRMIPPVLSGTLLGEQMLEFDCRLKQFAASLLHPDTPSGSRFWRAFFARLAAGGGDGRGPIRVFNKVWIVPEKFVVYEKEPGSPVPDSIQNVAGMHVSPEDLVGYVCESRLRVNSEQDLHAYEHNGVRALGLTESVYAQTFNEIILPIIDTEVNAGRQFAGIRQAYHAIGLAAFFRRRCGDHPRLAAYVGSNRPRSLQVSVSVDGTDLPMDSARETPHDAWSVPENRLFHARYMRLFREGLYRVARRFDGEDPSTMRVFFAGAIDLRTLGEQLDRRVVW